VLSAGPGHLELDGVVIAANTASGSSARGGGLYAASAAVTVDDSRIEANTTSGTSNAGGGAWVADDTMLSISSSSILTNSSGSGGGLRIGDTQSDIDSTTIAGNQGGGVSLLDGVLTLTGSTVSGNTGVNGGGVVNASGTLNAANTTFSGNSATSLGAAVYSSGSTTLRHVTVTDNIGPNSIWGQVTLRGSIVLSATVSCASQVTSGGWNVTSDSTCGLTAIGDTVGDPLLGALLDNGGPGATHLPAPVSLVIDAIPPGTPGLCDSSTPSDQRGVERPLGSGCDIGAVEQ
jgi:predicted outer membrane repeat protein